ncbi:MAG: hypothetical protein WAN50_04425 [Minisyncoccia bacterium]
MYEIQERQAFFVGDERVLQVPGLKEFRPCRDFCGGLGTRVLGDPFRNSFMPKSDYGIEPHPVYLCRWIDKNTSDTDNVLPLPEDKWGEEGNEIAHIGLCDLDFAIKSIASPNEETFLVANIPDRHGELALVAARWVVGFWAIDIWSAPSLHWGDGHVLLSRKPVCAGRIWTKCCPGTVGPGVSRG